MAISRDFLGSVKLEIDMANKGDKSIALELSEELLWVKHTADWSVCSMASKELVRQEELIKEWEQKALNWLASPEAAARLEGYQYLGQKLARAKEDRELLLKQLKKALSMLERADCSTGYCCCGSKMDTHNLGDGHSPVDEGDYYLSKCIENTRELISSMENPSF